MSVNTAQGSREPEAHEPTLHEVWLALDAAMKSLGFNEIGGGDNTLGIGTEYVFDATGQRFEITISTPEE